LSDSRVVSKPLGEFSLWEKFEPANRLLSFDLEITARCNNSCRHCYINLPADDGEAKKRELTIAEIERIAGDAVSLGALWCLVTGGEPLLRRDFPEIFVRLKKKGLLVSVFTNACLVTDEHIRLFKAYPPRDIEVSVYGVTRETYESVTRKAGSFDAFERGLARLLDGGVRVRFKAMVMRSNVHEIDAISAFCRQKTKDYFRFDPLLHMRYDRDPARNSEIRAERLSAEEIAALERRDPERWRAVENSCDELVRRGAEHTACNHLFHCGAGRGQCSIGFDGTFRLCPDLWHPDYIQDLKKFPLTDVYPALSSSVRDRRSSNPDFLNHCSKCAIINYCMWCPARSFLESGELDCRVDYFCRVAHARTELLDIGQT
jgi:radical SAM protein with 4Fe4S-binding SPASM domain